MPSGAGTTNTRKKEGVEISWFKVDDRFASSRKVLRIPRHRRASAIGLWTLAGAWSAHDLTDGFIPAFMVEEFGADESVAEDLVKADLWCDAEHDNEAGYMFIKWGEYQPLKSEVEANREYERERKRQQRRDKGGKFAGEKPVPDVSENVPPGHQRDITGTPEMSQPCPTVPVPSRPDPTRSNTPSNGGAFDEFWNAYPRKIAKKEAVKKFAKAVKDGTDPNTIIAGAKTYAASVAGKEQKYVAHPTTWLNQGRWEDEADTPAPKPFDLWNSGGPI